MNDLDTCPPTGDPQGPIDWRGLINRLLKVLFNRPKAPSQTSPKRTTYGD